MHALSVPMFVFCQKYVILVKNRSESIGLVFSLGNPFFGQGNNFSFSFQQMTMSPRIRACSITYPVSISGHFIHGIVRWKCPHFGTLSSQVTFLDKVTFLFFVFSTWQCNHALVHAWFYSLYEFQSIRFVGYSKGSDTSLEFLQFLRREGPPLGGFSNCTEWVCFYEEMAQRHRIRPQWCQSMCWFKLKTWQIIKDSVSFLWSSHLLRILP